MKCDLKNIDLIVNKLRKIINNQNIIVLLKGDLASGKTTLVKSYVKSMDIKEKVTSPTYCLQNIYHNNIYHYDMYNKTLKEFINLGMLEELDKKGVHFIEWGDDKLKKILDDYGFNSVIINIEKLSDTRIYKVTT